MANAIINVGQTGGQVNISTAAAPATPAAGVVTLYAGTDKALHALNSDGVDITIAAAGASSPITVVNTNSLISDAIGATAGTRTRSIALGLNATTSQNCSVVIGGAACALGSNPGAVVIGNGACSPLSGFSESGANVAIGLNAIANGSDQGIGRNAIAIGPGTRSGTALGSSIAIGVSTIAVDGSIGIQGSVCSENSINIGPNTFTTTSSSNTTVVGRGNTVNANSCNSTVLGSSNTSCSDTCQAVILGNSNLAAQNRSVVIGNGSCSLLGGNGLNTGSGAVVIGDRVCSLGNGNNSTFSNVAVGSNIKICGSPINPDIVYGTTITTCNTNRGGNVAIGWDATVCNQYNAVLIGSASCIFGTDRAIAIGQANIVCGGDDALAIGQSVRSTAACTITIGRSSCATAAQAISIGSGNVASNAGATVIGNGITSEKTNTVHVNSLIAYGQAASKTNAIGSTGGTVTINWDNSNIQTLTLDSNISTLTKSNPIDGAVYTLFLTQGGTGGKTVSWGADVEWPGGTPPTLSPTAGAVDAVSLVYIAGITGYYGNANLNFS